MRTLGDDPDYKDRVDVEIVEMKDPDGAKRAGEHDWGPERHGLVIKGPDGDVKHVIQGHSWGERDDGTALRILKERLKPLLAG